MYVCVCVCVCEYIYIYIHTDVRMWVCVCVCREREVRGIDKKHLVRGIYCIKTDQELLSCWNIRGCLVTLSHFAGYLVNRQATNPGDCNNVSSSPTQPSVTGPHDPDDTTQRPCHVGVLRASSYRSHYTLFIYAPLAERHCPVWWLLYVTSVIRNNESIICVKYTNSYLVGASWIAPPYRPMFEGMHT